MHSRYDDPVFKIRLLNLIHIKVFTCTHMKLYKPFSKKSRCSVGSLLINSLTSTDSLSSSWHSVLNCAVSLSNDALKCLSLFSQQLISFAITSQIIRFAINSVLSKLPSTIPCVFNSCDCIRLSRNCLPLMNS